MSTPKENPERDTPRERPPLPHAPEAPRLRSIPAPTHKEWTAHTLVDVVAIGAILVLAIYSDLDSTVAATIVTIISSGWVLGQVRSGKNGLGPSSLLMGFVEVLAEMAKRGKGLVLPLVVASGIGLGGCAGVTPHEVRSGLDELVAVCDEIEVRYQPQTPEEVEALDQVKLVCIALRNAQGTE